MLDTWNESIFSNIKNRLQDSAMKLVHAERLGEAFDSQLVIGVRESYGEKPNAEFISAPREIRTLLPGTWQLNLSLLCWGVVGK